MRLVAFAHFFTRLSDNPSRFSPGRSSSACRSSFLGPARLGVATAAAAAALTVAGCGANARSTPDRAEERAEEARQQARDARADAERARHQAAEEQIEKQQALDAQHDAERRAAAADQRAADAEMRADRDRHGYPPARTGVTERQAERALLFSPGSVELSVDARASLDETARAIRSRAPGHRVVVEGYADASGAEDANRDLSQRRADAVTNYLVSRGVPRDRIETKAMGVRSPSDREDTDAARAQDRRVEVLIQP